MYDHESAANSDSRSVAPWVEVAEGSQRFRLRIRDLVVFVIFVTLVFVPVIYSLLQFSSPKPVVSDAEKRSIQRAEYPLGTNGQPIRFLKTEVLEQQVTVFASGPQDTIRTARGGMICSIDDIDDRNGYIVYVAERNGLGGYHWSNLRFCEQLNFMGNPNMPKIEEKLKSMTKLTPVADLARPLSEPQADGPFRFSNLEMTADGTDWELTGTVQVEWEIKPQYSWFVFEIFHGGEAVAEGEIALEQLVSGQARDFAVVVKGNNLKAGIDPNNTRIKIVLRMTSDRNFGNRALRTR